MIRLNALILISLGLLLLTGNSLNGQTDTTNKIVNICGILIPCKDSVVLRNTVEYHLNNDIIYIREYYPDKKLKSESYWVDDIIPVYQIKQYNQQGYISKIIDKSIGKYDLCYVLNKIQSIKELEGKQYSIGLSNSADNYKNLTWMIAFNEMDDRFGSSGDLILIDSKTGRIEESSFSFSGQLANIIEPTPDQLPTFPGDIKAFEKNILFNIDIPQDSIINVELNVRYSVDSYGKVGNFHVEGGTKYLNNEVLKLAKQMPDWKEAKDHNTDGASNVEDDDYGKYIFSFSVIFRRFD